MAWNTPLTVVPGQLMDAAYWNAQVRDNLTYLHDESLPAGTIIWAAMASATGWLACDGASYLRADYTNLFNALGGAASPYGLPDGTHFNVPDARGRAIVGAGSGSGLTARARGDVFGTETHALAVAELPAHTHTGSTAILSGGGTATISTFPTFAGTNQAEGDPGDPIVGAMQSLGDKLTNPFTVVASVAFASNQLASQGAGGAHANVQPAWVVAYVIKT